MKTLFMVGDEVTNIETDESGLITHFESNGRFWVDYGYNRLGPFGSGPHYIFRKVTRKGTRSR